MSAFFFEIGLFSLKTLILVLCLFGGLITLLVMVAKSKRQGAALEVHDLSKDLEQESQHIRHEIGTLEEKSALKKQLKKTKKKNKKHQAPQGRTFVLDFNGDVKASQTEVLKRLITNVITVCDPQKDEVLIRIESPGGMVHGYGLAAAQILRLRDKGIRITASVDKVAASGGYLMACVANEIIAAPFAILGSIGVVAQVPNLNRLLKKNNIDYEEMTSGEYKRTISILGEITPDGRRHFEGKLTVTHELFKDFVKDFRPNLDLAQVANGDHWYGTEALGLGLIDKIQTSDDFILSQHKVRQIVKLSITEKKTMGQKIAEAVQLTMDQVISQLILRP